MNTSELKWVLSSSRKPDDYQECLVYSLCEGFQIATWKVLDDDGEFYVHAQPEPLTPEQAKVWAAMPSMDAMRLG